ncbi:MAG: hypothetical protein EXS12_01775 [Phycisphaerales bacterium]|nr:hypothetical protein [Phycisphaerales bacterium]
MTFAIPFQVQMFLEDRKRLAKLGVALFVAILVCIALLWNAMRLRQPPSIFGTPIDNTLEYLTLKDFSKLPLDKRIRFMLELTDRFRKLKSTESAAMAAFLAGLAGPARDQLRDNVKMIAKDVLTEGATTYMSLPPAKRDLFIDAWILKWQRTLEKATTGKEDKKTDSERLDAMRDQGKRNTERQSRMTGGGGLTDRGASGFLDFWQGEIEGSSTPKEQGQITKFLDDVRTRLINR